MGGIFLAVKRVGIGVGNEQMFGWWGGLASMEQPVLFLGLHDPPELSLIFCKNRMFWENLSQIICENALIQSDYKIFKVLISQK